MTLRSIMKIAVLSVALIATVVGPSTAKIVLKGLIEVDCSAYRRNADGTWTILRSNTITDSHEVGREVIPEDEPKVAQLTSGRSVQWVLDTICARSMR
jgi:hypothetical protein